MHGRSKTVTQEERDFAHFESRQLKDVDMATGRIDVWVHDKNGARTRQALDIGSKNQDGYVRVYCNGRLRMKHRLLFWLHHRYLPIEVDHDDKVRDHNSISNLIASDRSRNTTGKTPRTYKQLVEAEVRVVCEMIASGDYNITQIAAFAGRSRTQIKAIQAKKYWKDVSDQYF